jgi:hypothetical protein
MTKKEAKMNSDEQQTYVQDFGTEKRRKLEAS